MCLKEILEKAEQFEKQGNKKEAAKWFEYAERYEEIMKRNQETILRR